MAEYRATVIASDNGNYTFTVSHNTAAYEGIVRLVPTSDGSPAYQLEYAVGNHVSTQELDAAVMCEVMAHFLAGKQPCA